MIERTEELGLAARLTISVGGQRVELRTLNLEESEKWQAKLATAVANFDIPAASDPAKLFATLAKQPTAVMVDLVTAYDVDRVLGTAAALRKRFTQIELYHAVKQMVRAELPFLEDARSMVEAFGPQLRAMAAGVLLNLYERESSTNGRSLTGDSTPELSAVGSLRNDSSSSGNTDSAA